MDSSGTYGAQPDPALTRRARAANRNAVPDAAPSGTAATSGYVPSGTDPAGQVREPHLSRRAARFRAVPVRPSETAPVIPPGGGQPVSAQIPRVQFRPEGVRPDETTVLGAGRPDVTAVLQPEGTYRPGTYGAAPPAVSAVPEIDDETRMRATSDVRVRAAKVERRKPKAGRNLPAAIGVGVGLITTVALSLAFRPEPFVAFAVIAICAAIWELAQALARQDLHLPVLPLAVGTAGIMVSSYVAGPEALMASFMLTVAGCVLWRVLDGPGTAAVRDAAAAVFATAYLPFMAGFVMLMLAQDHGRMRVLVFILLAAANDTGGYVAGVFFGRHPLAPKVSPKKSWEGLAGSVVLTTVVGVLGAVYLLHVNVAIGVALGLLAPLTATLGDLAESLIKRDLGVKDMGTLLPGHGGVLDRVDSLLLTAPFVYLLLMVAM